jgi:hypothetical protein
MFAKPGEVMAMRPVRLPCNEVTEKSRPRMDFAVMKDAQGQAEKKRNIEAIVKDLKSRPR